MTSDTVANLNFWSRSSLGKQKIRDIGSIGRQIRDCSPRNDKFAETALVIFKVVAKRSEPDCKGRIRELQRAAVLFIKATGFKRPWFTYSLTIQLRFGRQCIRLVYSFGTLKLAMRSRCFNGPCICCRSDSCNFGD
jgi:hypothetical protein